ncbi:MAG: hypothetical protein N3F06_03565 [Nitrososphaerales archaeon]|nr:hypothetical protein [Nitrososphaerales archaeon]
MKAFLILCEGGIIVTDDDLNIVFAKRYADEPFKTFNRIQNGEFTPEIDEVLSKAVEKGFDEFVVMGERLRDSLVEKGFKAETFTTNELGRIWLNRVELMVRSGLASQEESLSIIRDFAIERSEAKLRELSSKLDLQLVESIQALDEVDKSINLLATRVKEWYGLHFPELASIISDLKTYCRFVVKYGRRDRLNREGLIEDDLPEKKVNAILNAALRSKGGELRDEDLKGLMKLSEEVLHLFDLKEYLMKHVIETIEQVAPNVAMVAGPTVGARLIAKAGSLEKLAQLPSSTIQILGAEKALFRALRTKSKPPKHGIIFQHPAVHSAPKWQRGKIARSIANKIAIAARIDLYRGGKEKRLEDDLKKRLEEIKVKYSEPPTIDRKKLKEVKKRGKGS